ncbi:MAG TPA: PIN domain-containing protein, partial [Nakamurella sp.]
AARMPLPGVRARLGPLITGGLVGTCATLDAEALYSARNLAEYEQVLADRRTAYEHLPIDDDHWTRAFQAHHVLARSGRHRAVGIADLLTATVAAQHRLTIVHYDADFDIAAQVIDFDHRWVAERGTL